jgi:nitrogen fixation/metabolism regulation signal transduction histidine kinase
MKLLTNPIVMRMALVLMAAAFSFFTGLAIIRRMRRSLVENRSVSDERPSQESLPLHTYHAVIQQLKQQKHELLTLQQADRRRAKTSENVSAAVLAHLSSGVLFINTSGLVRQANNAARDILGFASPLGLNVAEIFRAAAVLSPSGSGPEVAALAGASVRGKTPLEKVVIDYRTPSGDERTLEITLTPIPAADGEVLGTACLINDQTPLAQIRKQIELRGEMSTEMALELRNSLTTISGYAQQLAASRDPELARQLASDIAAESAHLDRTIGGFLAGSQMAKAASQL